MNKIILITLSFLFTSSCFSQQNIKSLDQVVKKVENAVFIVYTFDKNNRPIAQGSGFFIQSSGIGITNFHVLNGSSSAIIKTKNGEKYTIASVLDFDSKTDLVKFRVDNLMQKSLPTISVSSSLPKRGENIFNISNPLGLEQTISSGIVSSIREISPYGTLIQITAPISEGSSGSPILNEKGEVVGVATMGFKQGQNLNFAVSTKQVADLKNNLNKQISFISKNPLATENYENAKKEYIQGNSQNALYYLEKELNSNKYNHLALNLKGRIQTDNEDYVGAIESLFYAIRLDSLEKDYQNNFGIANAKYGYSLKGDFDSYMTAFIAYTIAIKLDPKYELAYFNKAFLIYNNIYSKSLKEPVIEKNNIYDALELVNKAIELNPEYSNAYCLRARIKFELKDNWSALSDIDKAILIDNQEEEFYFFRGEVKSFGLKDYTNAILDFNEALNLSTKDKMKADILGLRCITKALLNDYQGACNDATLAYQLHQDDLYLDLKKQTCK
jgi:serine protease Do